VRRLRRLATKRAVRWGEGACVIEGPDLVAAALDAGAEFEALYVDPDAAATPEVAVLVGRASAAGVRTFALGRAALEKVSDAVTPQGVLGAVRLPVAELSAVGAGAVVVAHDLRDPGNVGTLIRSADAAGAAGVVLSGQSVDPTNPKTLRASAGSVFHVPVVVCDLDAALERMRAIGARTYAAVVHGGTDYRRADLAGSVAFVLGNEAAGLAGDVVARCDAPVSIAMAGRAESLNAGVAGSLLLFEALAQRRDAKGPPPPSSL
jgi:RNA methyltransferase, TrmH family